MELSGSLHHTVLGSEDRKHFLEIKILTRERQPQQSQTPRQTRTNTTGNHRRAQTHSTGRRKRKQNSKSARILQQTPTKSSHNVHAAFTHRLVGETKGWSFESVCLCMKGRLAVVQILQTLFIPGNKMHLW